MPQLHLYVSDEVAEAIRARAEQRGISVSRLLADIVEREVPAGWPRGWFERYFGAWEGEPLERPPELEMEDREPLR